ncbi:hypothetical protein BgiMline_007660 [Biomphalaria glabrata]|nr:hypothetical protein BgiMline_023216 [Biomphalaria glabrata]
MTLTFQMTCSRLPHEEPYDLSYMLSSWTCILTLHAMASLAAGIRRLGSHYPANDGSSSHLRTVGMPKALLGGKEQDGERAAPLHRQIPLSDQPTRHRHEVRPALETLPVVSQTSEWAYLLQPSISLVR